MSDETEEDNVSETFIEEGIKVGDVFVPGRDIAKVAFFYKVNPEELSETTFFLLLSSLQEMQAREEIHLRTIETPMSPDRAYYLELVTTQDYDKAEYARAKQCLMMERQRLKL